jgi:hypothetical protein
MRQFRRLERIRLRTSAQQHVPADFNARMDRACRHWPSRVLAEFFLPAPEGQGLRHRRD